MDKLEDICKYKCFGDLGIKNLGSFNWALLEKCVWKFSNEPDRLWARVVKLKYGA